MKALLRSGAAVCAYCSLLVSLALGQPGSLDLTFNPGSGPSGLVYCMALQSNGQIVIGGIFGSYDGANQKFVARINTNGNLDSSFSTGTLPISGVGNLLVQQDGSVVIGNGVGRLRPDGSIDTSFVYADEGWLPLALQGDGKIIICDTNAIKRLNTNCPGSA